MYQELIWNELGEGEWAAYGTVYSASEDWDPFQFRINQTQDGFRVDGTDPELIPADDAALMRFDSLSDAKAACETINQEAFERELGCDR